MRRGDGVEIKTDGEFSIVEIARRVQTRRDKKTTVARTSVGGHQEIGAVERTNGTVQAQLRAYYLDVQDRMKVRIIPGTQLFPWMLRHSVWTIVRYQSDQRTKQTPYERKRGCQYESAFADADKMRAGKLDSAWVNAVWVGRVDRSNEQQLLTTKGCNRSRMVRRIPDGNQASYQAEVQGLPWETLKRSAEMLRNHQGHPRKDGSPAQARTTTTTGRHEATRDDPTPRSSDDHLRQPTTETDVIDQSIVMDSGTAESGDCVWRSIRVIFGRRKGARSWQEHFDSILRSEDARQRGFTVESHPKCPTLYDVREADGVIELHLDDGHGCGKETIVAELLTFLSEKIEMKNVQGIWCGSNEHLKTVRVRDGEEIDEHPEQETFPVSVAKTGDERLQGRCFSKIGQGVHRL